MPLPELLREHGALLTFLPAVVIFADLDLLPADQLRENGHIFMLICSEVNTTGVTPPDFFLFLFLFFSMLVSSFLFSFSADPNRKISVHFLDGVTGVEEATVGDGSELVRGKWRS